ncbi:MAG: hypothetical protein AcusKO_47300 [Acuticoccus sp.]
MRLSVPDMHCGGCLRSVTRAIAAIDTTATVTPDLDRRDITVATRARPQDILAALASAGFPAVMR